MEGGIIHSTRTFFYVFANWKCPNENEGSDSENFSSQNCSKFAVEWTEIVRFLKYVRKLTFFEKTPGFSKSVEVAILL